MNRRTMAMAAVMAAASAPVVAQQETKPAVVEQASPQDRRYVDRQLVGFYLDQTGMSKEELARAVSGAKKFLDARRGGTQLVALISYNGRSVLVGEDFTGDFDRLEKTLDQLQDSGGGAAAGGRAATRIGPRLSNGRW